MAMPTFGSTSDEERSNEDIQLEKLKLEDDDGQGVDGGGDPAVLAVGPARKRLQYSRDDLLKMRDLPMSRCQPDVPADILKLVTPRKRSDTPSNEDAGGKGDAPSDPKASNNNGNNNGSGRRPLDPRERVRRESENGGGTGGIVLSPQRRSFISGCGAPMPNKNRPESPIQTKTDPGPPRETRRIGSGRILTVNLTAVPWERNNEERQPERGDNIYRPPRDRGDDRYDRRSFSRDSYDNMKRDGRDDRGGYNDSKERGNDRRMNNNNRYHKYRNDEEPEWFSGGPTSQLETIELRGFDEPKKQNSKDGGEKSSASSESNWPSSSSPVSSPVRSAMEQHNDNSNEQQVEEEKETLECAPVPEPPNSAASDDRMPDFNFEDFLNSDNIPGLLTNGSAEESGGGGSSGSRFSRWFRRDSSPNPDHIINHIMDDIESASREDFPPTSRPLSLMELLQRAQNNAQPSHPPNAVGAGGSGSAHKIHSLEELEANMRGVRPNANQNTRDLAAFKRLLAQVSTNDGNKFQEQSAPHIPHELLYKLLQLQNHQRHQQQQEQLLLNKARQFQQQQHQQPPTPHPTELLQRPEAQAILNGLKGGEITVGHVVQQLSNPNLQSRHRDVLMAILKLHSQQSQAPPLGHVPPHAQHPAAPHHLVLPPQQPLRVSPLPHTGVAGGRIPSPRELAAHTQSIMQSALIKRKLEEQRENYRRRHDQKQQPSLSFTPTSVLRKMTAEKEPEPPVNLTSMRPGQWQQAMPKVPQGRPIVKSGGGGPPSLFAPVPQQPEYSHNYISHMQQMNNARHFTTVPPTPITPRPIHAQHQVNNMNSNTTLQQLLLQSHHRNLNEETGEGLSRWFSPELLAQASAGKLPSRPNALSLEELERRALATHNW